MWDGMGWMAFDQFPLPPVIKFDCESCKYRFTHLRHDNDHCYFEEKKPDTCRYFKQRTYYNYKVVIELRKRCTLYRLYYRVSFFKWRLWWLVDVSFTEHDKEKWIKKCDVMIIEVK